MMMKFDILTWINYFVGAFICLFGMFLSGTIITNNKVKEIKLSSYFFLLFFSFFMIINTLLLNNISKMFGIILILYLVFKIIYKWNNNYTVIISIVTYITCILGEVSFYLIVILLEKIIGIKILINASRSSIANIIIAVLCCLYAILLKNRINKLLDRFIKVKSITPIFISIVTILIIFSSMYNLYLNNWIFNHKFIMNIIVIFGCLFLLINIINQYIKNKEITDKYKLLEDYMKTSAEIIEKYSSTIHKYKNNLIAIKGYINSSTASANNYIDTLLGNFENKKYTWFNKINRIPIDALRYLIYFKLSQAETSNLKISVDISSEIKKISDNRIINKNKNIMLELVGEYFDNAIYASKNSKDKQLCLSMYVENNVLYFVLSNTYEGNVDLSSITKNGFTTKGKGHGYGLYGAQKVLNTTPTFEVKYDIIDNNFFVILTLKLN